MHIRNETRWKINVANRGMECWMLEVSNFLNILCTFRLCVSCVLCQSQMLAWFCKMHEWIYSERSTFRCSKCDKYSLAPSTFNFRPFIEYKHSYLRCENKCDLWLRSVESIDRCYSIMDRRYRAILRLENMNVTSFILTRIIIINNK